MTHAVNETAKLSLLLDIASKAVDFVERQQTRRFAQNALNSAYYEWREANDVHQRIETDSAEWKLMMEATTSEYEDVSEAKREETNAAKRLRTSVYKYKAIVDGEKAALAGIDPVEHDTRGEIAEMFAQTHP